MVQGMAAVGVRQDLICTQVRNRATGAPIDRKTLRRAFRAELTAGMIEATQAVDHRAVRERGRSPQRHGSDLLAEEPRPQ